MLNAIEITFIVACWALLIANVCLIGLKVYATVKYPGSLQYLIDQVEGHRRVWEIRWNVVIAAITAVFLYNYHMAS